MRLGWLVVLLSRAALVSGADDPGHSAGWEKEAALGRALAAQFSERATPLESAAVREYVDHLRHSISSQINAANFPFTIKVLVEDRCPTLHDPVTFPGGYVFVPAALLLAAHDQAEFAGMLAQAMERVAQRDGLRQVVRGEVAQLAAVPIIFVGGVCAEDQRILLAQQSKGLVSEPSSVHATVLNDDALAAQALARAGIDPAGLLRYLDRVRPRAAYTVYTALPEHAERLAALRSVIEGLPPANYAAHNEEFQVVQQEARRLMERLAKSPSSDAETPNGAMTAGAKPRYVFG